LKLFLCIIFHLTSFDTRPDLVWAQFSTTRSKCRRCLILKDLGECVSREIELMSAKQSWWHWMASAYLCWCVIKTLNAAHSLHQPSSIDVKKRFFTFFIQGTFLRFLTFFILPTFFLFLKTFIENTIW